MVQKADFVEILEAMDGLPVTVRLLDPPLHEFLPRTSRSSLVKKAGAPGSPPRRRTCSAPPSAWHEFNPMLGTRGVRLGVVKPGLYAMQVRALMEAAAERVAAGGNPIVEIMIPLTVTREELAAGPRLGGGGHRRGEHQGPRSKPIDVTDRHDDRDAPGRAPGRRDRRGGRLLLASAPTTSPR